MTRAGDDMIAKMGRSGTGPSKRGASAPEAWEDDAAPASRGKPGRPVYPVPSLTSLGPQRRPNGVHYQPRAVGDFEDLALLRDARVHNEHVLLYGPPGTGKSAVAEAAFARDAVAGVHDGLESIVGTADTTESDFVGTFVQDPRSGAFEWRPGPLHRSVLHDVPLFVDEIALIDPRVLSVLYPLMDGRGVLRITMNPDLEPLTIGPNWFVLAAYNPDVPGATLSEALRDRFSHHIEVRTDWQLARDLGVHDEIVDVAKNLDKRRIQGDIRWSPQLRSLLDFQATAERRGFDYALANLLAKAPADDRDVVAGALLRKFGDVAPLRLGRRFAA
jgi:MoxR-like ATPase